MITQSELIERLYYDEETGEFIYRYDYNRLKAGDVAGRPNSNGHIQISFNGKRYMAHNLAWLYKTGEYPIDFEVDHKDRNPGFNAWNNLRKSSRQQNTCNRSKPKHNSTGTKGVTFNRAKGKYVAQIGFNGKKYHLGYFDNVDDAKSAYDLRASEWFGEYNPT